ncbi:hypothetical protein FQA39_LY06410 [Lamprigera yunnana]|nr:hypothetical protein FQA39_LY06410 [Lamprigera yunnana]
MVTSVTTLKKSGYGQSGIQIKQQYKITPPNDGNKRKEDCGDEDANINIYYLSGRQLQAQKEYLDWATNLIMTATMKKKLIHLWFNSEIHYELDELKFNDIGVKGGPTFQIFICSKTQKDLPLDSVNCFELLLDEQIRNFLVNIFITYAKSKEDNNFDIDTNELKCFLAIIMLSRL